MATFLERVAHRLAVCYFCIMSIWYFGFPHFGFEDDTVVLIAPVRFYCLPLTFVLKVLL